MEKTKKVVKKVVKVNHKQVAKDELSALFQEFLEEKGIKVDSNHIDYGFTKGTLLVQMDKTDVQVKFITPKAGEERYSPIEIVYEDEVED